MKLLTDEDANVQMIGAVVGILVTIMIAVLVFYNIAGSIDTSSIDADLNEMDTISTNSTSSHMAANATTGVLDQAATFFTIAPIIAIIVVAVVILGYVSKIGG